MVFDTSSEGILTFWPIVQRNACFNVLQHEAFNPTNSSAFTTNRWQRRANRPKAPPTGAGVPQNCGFTCRQTVTGGFQAPSSSFYGGGDARGEGRRGESPQPCGHQNAIPHNSLYLELKFNIQWKQWIIWKEQPNMPWTLISNIRPVQ